ncbi:MAG: transketolase [Rickettsiaceae bacterium]
MKLEKNQKLLLQELSNCIRILTADAVEVAKSGHPGMPLGMADIMTVLAFNFLKFNPNQPKWFTRDRLVLSAGHGSMLLYAFYYLTGFKDFSLNEIKTFRTLGSKAAGHPEKHMYEAIETTTGPLGQGFANSVGMAIAQKKYQAHLGKEISDYNIYTIVGDGCLMEGISYEASSLAGHLNLDNLIVIFDDNGISIDGSTSLAVSDDHLAKFKAFGFEVESIDGHDFDQINASLQRANASVKPYFIACKTIIGKGVDLKAGSEKSHGSPLGKSEIEYLKNNSSFNHKPFEIEKTLLDAWKEFGKKNIVLFDKWQKLFAELDSKDKEYIEGLNKIDYVSFNVESLLVNDQMEATRVSSGKILQEIVKNNDKIIAGSADLALSNNIFGTASRAINAEDFSGNFIHYGVRENAMAAIMNGLALSGFLPISGTFFVFSYYMRPSIRLAAIMKNKVIYVMTHDSIGVGEDGPTHQPIEHLASFRAMPNIKVFRPADFIETLECYIEALNYDGPSMLVLSRQNLKQLRNEYNQQSNLCATGAYIISEAIDKKSVDIVIFASGSEVLIAVDVKETLEKSYNKSVRVISVPCFENLEQMEQGHLDELVSGAKHRVAIEAGSVFGWHKLIGLDGLFFGIDEFGLSAPAGVLYDYFGLTAEKIVKNIVAKG